jgi:hypothetical protein
MKLASPWWVGSTLCSPRELEGCVARVQLPEKLVVSGALAARLSNFYLPLVRILHV